MGTDNSFSEHDYSDENLNFLADKLNLIGKDPSATNLRLLRGVISVDKTNRADLVVEQEEEAIG